MTDGTRPHAVLGAALLDLVVPQQCGGCGQPGTVWCPACVAATRASVRRLDLDGMLGAAAGGHDGPLGRAVVAFKDAGWRRLAGPLGRCLAVATTAVLAEMDHRYPGRPASPVWLVPVPARADARRRRGADPMAVLAARAARELRAVGWPAHRCRLLHHVGPSRDQVGLDRVAREGNVHGTLRAAAPPPGILVVVDDVATTGATLREAVRALRAASPGPRPGAPAPADGTILAATITMAPRVRGHASGSAAD